MPSANWCEPRRRRSAEGRATATGSRQVGRVRPKIPGRSACRPLGASAQPARQVAPDAETMQDRSALRAAVTSCMILAPERRVSGIMFANVPRGCAGRARSVGLPHDRTAPGQTSARHICSSGSIRMRAHVARMTVTASGAHRGRDKDTHTSAAHDLNPGACRGSRRSATNPVRVLPSIASLVGRYIPHRQSSSATGNACPRNMSK